ncbi:hypothetical protein JX266_007181 [Neoarthrinium moseri]|nr:hypothetical protein JX266_007181 [Neoarthrinium moseri]
MELPSTEHAKTAGEDCDEEETSELSASAVSGTNAEKSSTLPVPEASVTAQVELDKPMKSCLKKGEESGSTTTKAVTFGETHAFDITNGDPVPKSAMTAKDYRHWFRSQRDSPGRRRKKVNRRLRSALRRVITEWGEESRARELGGERRVQWRKQFLRWARANGFNGVMDGISRH